MPKKSAIEIMVLNPDPAIHHNNKSVHENLWIKKRYGEDNYLSIGVLLKEGTSELQFYFFENCDQLPHPKFYSSLKELQQDLPAAKRDIFTKTHKVYLMGHGDDESKYGFGNYHAHDDFSHPPDDTEQIYDDKFDALIQDILSTIHAENGEIGITLEACHADNLVTAERSGYTKSFLERLSAKYPHISFSGTGPWSNSKDLQESLTTDSRASGGFPTLHTPITSMSGSVWKAGNSVIFHHDFGQNESHQIAVRKSPFSSTETAKELKINTVSYARYVLQKTDLDDSAKKDIIATICANRDVLKIEDLKRVSSFPTESFEDAVITSLVSAEKSILAKEKNNYIIRVQEILARSKSEGAFTERDGLVIALGLKDLSVFDGHEDLRDELLANTALLSWVMVSCGKVLIAGPSNDGIIDLLLEKGIDINSVDAKGMTALHYAAKSFYNYGQKETLSLIKKLLECGANVTAQNNEGKTPLMLAKEHSKKGNVMAGDKLVALLQRNTSAVTQLSDAISLSTDTGSDSDKTQVTIFYKDEKKEYEHLMLVNLQVVGDAIDTPMVYDEEQKGWIAHIERPSVIHELFLITNTDKKKDEEAPLVSKGYLSLKEGVQQSVVNPISGNPKGELQEFLLTANGTIQGPIDRPDQTTLNPGDRYVTIYTPPGYDPNRDQPYDLQVTLDGGQYLHIMQMNVIFDNIIAEGKMPPVVTVFISPSSGPPNETALGFPPVMPKGWPLSMRFKEYACNPEFADTLAALPTTLAQQFNVTQSPDQTSIWGMSMGGLQAEYTALLHPEVFGNVVAQSPMAWNIPTQNGDQWREAITDSYDEYGIDVSWRTATAPLPEVEGKHDEYITQVVVSGDDSISDRAISPKPLRFYFDAGEEERHYDAKGGSANLVRSTELFANALTAKNHVVIDDTVHLLPGGHHCMTWMQNIAAAATAIHAPSLTAQHGMRPAWAETPRTEVDISDQEMTKSSFGQGSKTAQNFKKLSS